MCIYVYYIYMYVCVYPQQQWKAGKRRAEKDELIAGLFFTTIEHPDIPMERDTA